VTRHIAFERLHNFRDLGGYSTLDGSTVRWGRLYRSDSLGKLQGDDWNRFQELGIRTVIDLRYPWEIAAKGRVPSDDRLSYHNLSIEHRPYDQAALGADVEPVRFLADRYSELIEDSVDELRQVLQVIADGDSGPMVFHCASGKDRTGIVGAFVLGLLDVSEADIIADFALTELATERLLADWHAENPERDKPWPSFGKAPGDLMRLFLHDLNIAHGSLRGYVVNELGIREDLIAAMRAHLLAPGIHPQAENLPAPG
jgi:protein-tyrosine phosphatase